MAIGWTPPALNPSAVTKYVVAVSGLAPRTLPATATSLTVTGLPRSMASFGVKVSAVGPPGQAAAVASISVPRGYPSISAKRRNARVTFRGLVRAGSRPVVGGIVRIQRKTSTGWVTAGSVRTRSDGSYVTTIRRRTRAYYRAVFVGSPGAIGSISARHRW